MEDVIAPYFNIFEITPHDFSHSDLQWRKFTPSANNLNATTVFEWRTTNNSEYILPHMAYLRLRVQLQCTATGTSYTAFAPANPAQNLVTFENDPGLFNKGEYLINGCLVENVEQLQRCTYIRDLLEYSSDYVQGKPTNEFFYLDYGLGDTSVLPLCVAADFAAPGVPGTSITTPAAAYAAANIQQSITDAVNYALFNVGNYNQQTTMLNLGAQFGYTTNKGFIQRMNLTNGVNKNVTFNIPLFKLFGFTHHINRVFQGFEHLIRLTKNQVNDFVMTNADATVTGNNVPNINYLNAELWIPSLKPSLKVEKMICSQIAANTQVKVNWQACYHQSYLQAANTTPYLEVQVTKKRPTKIIIYMQNATDVQNFQGNSRRFINGGIISCRLEVNGRPLNAEGYSCSRNLTN